MGFGAASPAEARAKLEQLKLEASTPQKQAEPTSDAVAKLVQQVLRSASLEEARQHARDATSTTSDARLAPLFQSPSTRRDKATPGWPESVELYLGPTNSGKTHRSLDFLAEVGSGCYAGPLRALAWEVRRSMEGRAKDVWGAHPPSVGLWTGEEATDPDAPILCCTAEVAPSSGTVLVLDEVHWCADPQRGHAWTRLLMAARSGRYKHVRICGPVQAEPLLKRVFEKCSDAVTVHRTHRRSRLAFEKDPIVDFAAFLQQAKYEKRFVAIVAFSRAAVLSLAGAARKAGARASVIFGKLPPEARRKQLDDALSGRLDVLVCTDVIGHGINLPLDDVVFAETRKFDGITRRDLHVWEAAQVAGRAGRDDKPGRCWYLPKYGANVKLLTKAVKAANGDLFDGFDLDLSKAVLAPDLSALTQLTGSVPSILLLPTCVRQWREELTKTLNDGDDPLPWVKSGDCEEIASRLRFLQDPQLVPSDVRRALCASDLWHLARLPVREAHFEDVARAACLGEAVQPFAPLDSLVDERLEDEVQRLGDVLMASRRFPAILIGDDATDADSAMVAAVACHEALYLYGSRLIGVGVGRQIDDAHLCRTCGRPKEPGAKMNSKMCRRCFAQGQGGTPQRGHNAPPQRSAARKGLTPNERQSRFQQLAAQQQQRPPMPPQHAYPQQIYQQQHGPPMPNITGYAMPPQPYAHQHPQPLYAVDGVAGQRHNNAPPPLLDPRQIAEANAAAAARVRNLPPELLRDAARAPPPPARHLQNLATEAALIQGHAARRSGPLRPREVDEMARKVAAARGNQRRGKGRTVEVRPPPKNGPLGIAQAGIREPKGPRHVEATPAYVPAGQVHFFRGRGRGRGRRGKGGGGKDGRGRYIMS